MENLDELIKLVEFKIQATQRDNARTLRQIKANQRLQISDLEQILNNLNNLANKKTKEVN